MEIGQHFPGKDRPFFFYDPNGDGLIFFRSAEARDAAAKEAIAYYLEDGEWYPEVENVFMGCLTHRSTEVNREDRPSDPEEAESEGWPEGAEYRCSYEMRPWPIVADYTPPVRIERDGNFCACIYRCGDVMGWEDKACVQPYGLLRPPPVKGTADA